MPILNVEIVGALHSEIRSGLAQRLADAAGRVLESRPRGTWVQLHFLEQEEYAENGATKSSIDQVPSGSSIDQVPSGFGAHG